VGVNGGTAGSVRSGSAAVAVVPQERVAVTGRTVDDRAMYLQRRVLRSDLYYWTLLLGLLAGAGGLGAERGRGAAIFTASLPWRRRHRVLVRCLGSIGVVALAAIAAGMAMLLLPGSAGGGVTVAIAARFAVGLFAGGAVAAAASFALTNLLGRLLGGFALAAGVLAAIEMTGVPLFRDALFRVTGGSWLPDGGGFPMLAASGLLAIVASTAVLVSLAVDRMDL